MHDGDIRIGKIRTGVVGFDFESGGRPGPLLVRRTDDGGASWTTVYRPHRWLEDTNLHFSDRRRGWAVSEATSVGSHSRFDALYRTLDGGRSWHSLAYPLEPTDFAGPNTAWARPR